MTEPRPNLFVRGKDAVTVRWRALKARRRSVQHVADAWALVQHHNGGQYAAAITYFSFLALFPLLLLAVAVTGFVLHSHPAAQQDLLDHITSNIPGDLGKTLSSSVQTLIDARAGVGLVGLAGVVLSGLGWIGNLRAGVDAVWGLPQPKRNFFLARVANLVVLVGLGIGTALSLGLTIVGTSLTDQIVRVLGLDSVSGMHTVVKVLGLVVAALGDVIIFWWLLAKLPAVEMPARIALRGAVLAAVGFEVLKIVGTVTVAHTAKSPTAGPFAGLVAVLIWIQLVARYLLFCAAWTAVLTAEHRGVETAAQLVEPSPSPPGPSSSPLPSPEPVSAAPSPLAVAGSLIGVGAVAGAAVTWVAMHRDRDGEG